MNQRELEDLVARADSAWMPTAERQAAARVDRADCGYSDERYDGAIEKQGDVIFIADSTGVRQRYALADYSTEENIRGAHAALLRRQSMCNSGTLPGGACGY
jgi:hypothetical protein